MRAHVFVADVERPALGAADRHHLERVLRLRGGDEITVSDGAGRWRTCRFGSDLDITGDVVAVERPSPPIAVGFALTKGERPDWAVQKLTEVGVDRIVAFTAERSVVKWEPERAAGNAERWRRIAREASMQCRRVWLPEVGEVAPLDVLLGAGGVALAAPGGSPPSLDRPFVLVGPEGGWSPGELAAAQAAAVPSVALGPHILRAETAAMTAGVLLSALRTGLVGNV